MENKEREEKKNQKKKKTYRERSEQQLPPPERIDGVHAGDGEEPVDDAEAEGGDEGGLLGEAALDEHLGRVVGDDVDAAQLLEEHDDLRGQRRVAVAPDREQLLDLAAPHVHRLPLRLQQRVHVEQVPRRLHPLVPQLPDRRVRVPVPVLGQVPAG